MIRLDPPFKLKTKYLYVTDRNICGNSDVDKYVSMLVKYHTLNAHYIHDIENDHLLVFPTPPPPPLNVKELSTMKYETYSFGKIAELLPNKSLLVTNIIAYKQNMKHQ